jgi:hypothetical protein
MGTLPHRSPGFANPLGNDVNSPLNPLTGGHGQVGTDRSVVYKLTAPTKHVGLAGGAGPRWRGNLIRIACSLPLFACEHRGGEVEQASSSCGDSAGR